MQNSKSQAVTTTDSELQPKLQRPAPITPNPMLAEALVKPILFSTTMIQAILQGRKTQTRRIIKSKLPIGTKWFGVVGDELCYRIVDQKSVNTLCKCPYGSVGDVLWVRESYTQNGLEYYRYKADFKEGEGKFTNKLVPEKLRNKWKPSIHMPKKACRIFLEITDIKIERLQDISEEDAIKEGITMNNKPFEGWYWLENIYNTDSAEYAYECLWKSINGEKSWEQNLFVWVVTFKNCRVSARFLLTF